MNWISLALLTAIAAGAQSPTEKAQALNDQGNRLAQENEMASAISAYRESVDIWRSLGPSYEAHVAGTLVNLGVSVAASGNRPAAAKIYEEALVLHRRTLGNQNHRTITNMNLLATTWLMIGVRDRAEALLQETLAIEREFYPADIQTSRTLRGDLQLPGARRTASRGATARRRGSRHYPQSRGRREPRCRTRLYQRRRSPSMLPQLRPGPPALPQGPRAL